jgi:hypothetical protein
MSRKRRRARDTVSEVEEPTTPPDYKRALLAMKKTAKQKKLLYHGLTRRIDEIWTQKPKLKHRSSSSNGVKAWCGYQDAVAHGNVVDQQVSAYVKLGQYEFIRQRGSTVDPCTLAVIDLIRKQKWTPLLSQYVLYDEETRVKTHLDVLAQDEQQQLVLLELKATVHGNHDSYCTADSSCPLQLVDGSSLPNSYYSRNMIQLVMMLKMMHLRYGFLVRRGYVIRVGGGNLYSYPMDSTVLSKHAEIYETFRQQAPLLERPHPKRRPAQKKQ